MFKNYVTDYQLYKSGQLIKAFSRIMPKNCTSDEFYDRYDEILLNMPEAGMDAVTVGGFRTRLMAERIWYNIRRPFFNVYPLIKEKLGQLSGTVKYSEVTTPFKVLEVRSYESTFLMCDGKDKVLFITPLGSGFGISYILKDEEIGAVYDRSEALGDEGYVRAFYFIGAGVCMLAKDSKIIQPVILNQHRKDHMTPAEIAAYAEKAANRTGRIGFEIGCDIERMKATMHYRNAHFAKYYVTKEHPSYPQNAILPKVPVIIWRSGAVVNKNNVPSVPTGFKDQANAMDNQSAVDSH